MKKYLIIIQIIVLSCISNAQTLKLETLMDYLYMPEDSFTVYLLDNQWKYSLTDDVMKMYYNPNNGYEMIGIISQNSIVTNINYLINEPVSEQFKKTIGAANKMVYYVDSVSKNNKLMISISPKYKYNYFRLYECKAMFLKGNFAIIIPSLIKLKNDCENADEFDESSYYDIISLLEMSYNNIREKNKSLETLKAGLLVLKERGSGEKSKYYRKTLGTIGEMYRRLENYTKAKEIFITADSLYNKYKDYGHDYMIFQSEMALLYSLIGDTLNTLTACNKVINIFNEYYGDIFKTRERGGFSLLETIAVAYYRAGFKTEGELCFRHICNKLKPKDLISQSIYVSASSNLASILAEKKEWGKSIRVLNKISDISPSFIGTFLDNFLMDYLFLNNKKQIWNYYQLYNDYLFENNVKKIFYSINEDFYMTWIIASKQIDFLNYVAFKSNINEIYKSALENCIFYKTASLNCHRIIDDVINKSIDTCLQHSYIRIKELKHKLLFHYDKKEADDLEYKYLLNNLISKSNNLRSSLKKNTLHFEQIKNNLSDGEYVVEFCIIPYYENYPNYEDNFGAYIFSNHNSSPQIITLSKVKDIDEYYYESDDYIYFYNHIYHDKSLELYKLLFQEIEQYLPDANTIYYSPCGKLSLLNFDIFTDSIGTPLNQKYKLVRVSSTAEIFQVKSNNLFSSKTAAIFGNVNFDSAFYESSRGHIFGRLKYAKKEICSIASLLKDSNIATDVFEDKAATEQAFKNLSGHSPEILHIATHGFCFETDEKAADKPFAQNVNSYAQKESAMVLSGLALSGANNVWKGKNALPNVEDGILTAYEISQLDLSNTKLVVLSACETARGKIFPVDGVFGLQRAFKQAGAGAILMSLWKVDDGVTAIFMEHFYKFLFETNDRHKALKLAQDEVKKQFPDPYYWAAWVMLD